jgi:transposase InsO family protein
MESLFHTPKTELLHHRDYRTRWEAKTNIFESIEVFYNRSRRHSALGFIITEEYEMIRLAV